MVLHLLLYKIALKYLWHILSIIQRKTKIMLLVGAHFPMFYISYKTVVTSNFDWLTGLSVSCVIGYSAYCTLVLVLRHSVDNSSPLVFLLFSVTSVMMHFMESVHVCHAKTGLQQHSIIL